MELVSVIAAALAAFVLGAVYYMALSRQWMAAAGLTVGADGKPLDGGKGAKPFVIAAISLTIVAGMMRHLFASGGVDALGAGAGAIAGAGIGAFLIGPWLFLNAGYEGKTLVLPAINAGYATLAGAVMGAVLVLV